MMINKSETPPNSPPSKLYSKPAFNAGNDVYFTFLVISFLCSVSLSIVKSAKYTKCIIIVIYLK